MSSQQTNKATDDSSSFKTPISLGPKRNPDSSAESGIGSSSSSNSKALSYLLIRASAEQIGIFRHGFILIDVNFLHSPTFTY